MTEIALPDPQAYTLARIPEFLKQSELVRMRCEETRDLNTAKELKRRLEAVARYISDTKARRELEGETRLVEVLIGKLLGHAEMGRPKSSHDGNFPDPELAQVLDASDIAKTDRMRFRALAENEDLVKQMVSAGVTERAKILREIAGEPEPVNNSTPLQEGELRCPHCRRPVTLESLLTE